MRIFILCLVNALVVSRHLTYNTYVGTTRGYHNVSSVGSHTIVNGYHNIKFSLHTEKKEVSTVQEAFILARRK